ncbi:unnamed protein product [Moneuplotes crassus]|uniref:Uncharacterized protein n=1 Tax=Euplotes crassus TaxID=5936 RepID=A0AAD1Y2W0_EUPCR|nr:unnamed protein product [Moneuplotes crassus]
MKDRKSVQEEEFEDVVVTLDLFIKEIMILIEDPKACVLFYSSFNNPILKKIEKIVRNCSSEEEKIIETKVNLQSLQENIEQRIKYIIGVQSIFFELGKACGDSWVTVIYSNNNNFFDKHFIQTILKHSSQRLVSQKKASCLIDDIKNFELHRPDIFGSQAKNPAILSNTLENISKDRKFIDTSDPSTASTSNCSWTNDLKGEDHLQKPSSGLNHSSEKNSEMLELEKKLKNDSVFKSSLIELLEKLPKHFIKASENESLKYINSLENLVNQHLDKAKKSKKDKMTAAQKENYFLFVRNYLVKYKVTTGVVLDMWSKDIFGDSKERMVQSYSVKFNFEQLDPLIQSLKDIKDKFRVRGYELKGDFKLYGSVCYTIIKKILEHYSEPVQIPPTSNKNLIKNINHIVKNFYNSKSIKLKQKKLLEDDKKIKYLISEILKKREIWKMTNNKFIFSTIMVEKQLAEFNKYKGPKITPDLINDINHVIAP